MSRDDRTCFERLVRLREEIVWSLVRHQPEFFQQFNDLYESWQGPLPDVEDLFCPLQVEFLVYDALYLRDEADPSRCMGDKFIEFVAAAGYQIRPNFDADGMRISRTAVHLLAKRQQRTETKMNYGQELFEDLFRIYDPRMVGSDGSTLLHAICRLRRDSYSTMRMFFQINKDLCREVEVDARDPRGNTPLHVALAVGNKSAAVMLLRQGANPNLANDFGLTPLHVVLARKRDEDNASGLLKRFVDVAEAEGRVVDIDARDQYGRTPLQYAMSYLMPNTVALILTRNVDMARFSFPESFATGDDCKLRHVAGVMRCVEALEKDGRYQLRRSDALAILKFFAADGFFEKLKNLGDHWYDDPIFLGKAERLTLVQDCTLLDLILMGSEEADKQFRPVGYWMISRSRLLHRLPAESVEPCILHLCKKLGRGFFRRLAQICLGELMPYSLRSKQPNVLGKMIGFDKLTNEDLWDVCLAPES